jgi:hypothetical protein
MRLTQRAWASALLLLFALALGLGLPVQAQKAGGENFLLAKGDEDGLAWLRGVGAVRLAEYGAFSLWKISSGQAVGAGDRPASLRPQSEEHDLRGLRLGTTESVFPPSLRAAPESAEKHLRLLQFAGPPKDEWLDVVGASGQEVVVCLQDNACLIWGRDDPGFETTLSRLGDLVRRYNEFHPAYRLHPALRPGGVESDGDEVEVVIQLLSVPEARDDMERLQKIALRLDEPTVRVINFQNLRARLSTHNLVQIAHLPTVVNIEPYRPPRLQDEVQARIMAGSASVNGEIYDAYSPGYIEWLVGLGLPTDPQLYPIVDIVDDGIDQGNAEEVLHPDFHEFGLLSNRDRIVYLQSCLADLSTNGVGGHGNLNAGIAAGYNDQNGFPYANATGSLTAFRFGLGISPFGRIAGTKAFTDFGYWDISTCEDSYSGLVQRSYTAGARIANNSWGNPSARGEYDVIAQAYDALVRDADPLTPGNQEMLQIFSAGNQGSSIPGTLSSPATAKNTLSVGATRSPREGSSVENLAYYSSIGPTDDGRIKPDLVAPGSSIQGPASQDSNYTGDAIWARYYPTWPQSQTLYSYSSGTSHAAPAVAGLAQLAYAGYVQIYGNPPSAAMLKGLLLNSARYLNGDNTGGTLPSNQQGWGMANTGGLFTRDQHLVSDQVILISQAGEEHVWNLFLPPGFRDLRATLVWSDAPGLPATTHALINDLDLEVEVDGQTYHGNVFAGAYSITGALADSTNNVESVFLPVGRYHHVRVSVTAWNVSADGVPGNDDPTDQDFALVVTSQNGRGYYFPLIGR